MTNIYRMRHLLAGPYPKARSSIYDDVKRGLLPPPIALGARCSGWLASEVDAVIRARAAGATEQEVRDLVRRLINERLP